MASPGWQQVAGRRLPQGGAALSRLRPDRCRAVNPAPLLRRSNFALRNGADGAGNAANPAFRGESWTAAGSGRCATSPDRRRALARAAELPADAVIFDLEDAVAPGEKPAARRALARALCETDLGPRARLVRINPLDSPWDAADPDVIAQTRREAILLPKVDGPARIADPACRLAAGAGTGETRIRAMIETGAGVLAAARIARAPRLAGS
jgi:hypothetical protein